MLIWIYSFFFHSEIARFEEILIDYKRYKKLLFKLSPPEWQETQKTLKAKVLSDGDCQEKQNGEPEESAMRNGKYFVNQHNKDDEDLGNTG